MGNTIRSRLWLLLVAQNLWQVCSLPGSGELKKKKYPKAWWANLWLDCMSPCTSGLLKYYRHLKFRKAVFL